MILLKTRFARKGGFTLVETLVVLLIIGIMLMLTLPNVLKQKVGAEDEATVAKAHALNAAKVNYLGEKRRSAAESAWAALSNDERYLALKPYLAFPPLDLTAYTPVGYSFTMGSLYDKTTITRTADGTQITYDW